MRNIIKYLAIIILGGTSASSGNILPPDIESMEAAAKYSMSAGGQTMVVMYDGKIIFERYDNGGSPERLQMLASGSKSFVGIVAVAAVEDGYIKLDDKVSDVIEEWREDPLKSQITYRQLLNLTSGLTTSERGVTSLFPSWKDIVAKPMTGKPGQQFEYGGYSLNAFAYALELKMRKETFENYLKRRILDPLGIKLEWRFRCADGNPQVAGGAFMTARDWAKFGELVRLGGKIGDKQLINSKILMECFQGSEQNQAYGLTWWLKKPVTSNLIGRLAIISWGGVANSPKLPDDLVAACGAGKQRLYVISSLKLVIVRQGNLSRKFNDVDFLKILLKQKETGESMGKKETKQVVFLGGE
ncbi:MAG: beta-lactamase family protein [Candidatus Omnitrophica bacterium]|nr:beta-lactamase family protein [Candidatus Omnitrophota bacterium]